jgi:rhamnogalacturonyl hydrolase YesR
MNPHPLLPAILQDTTRPARRRFSRHIAVEALLSFMAMTLTTFPAKAATPQPAAIVEAMRRSNDYFHASFSLGNSGWARGAYQVGNMRAWETLGIQTYHDRAVAWAAANAWKVGPEDLTSNGHADSQTCGQSYISLYQIDPVPVRIASIKSELDALIVDPASEDDWWWIDAFFMAGPAFAKLGALETRADCYAQASKMYLYMKNTRSLFDSAHGLWYRDAAAKNRTGTYIPEFWSRGNGWVIAACARMLEILPAGEPSRAEYAGMLQTMAAALRPLQGADGFWRSSLKHPEQFTNPETSGTAFFTYAIAYGVNQGLLDSSTYTPMVLKAWDGLTTTALHTDGKLGYVQAIAAAPGASDYESDKDYGYGALLLAGSEILRLLGGPPVVIVNAGGDQSVIDADANEMETVTLNAGGTFVQSGEVTRYSWWLGPVYLGEGTQLAIDFPCAVHAVTLKAEHSSGAFFTDGVTVTVRRPVEAPVVVTASGFQTGNPPSNTLDGQLSTRWSQEGANQWIRYELPVTAILDRVAIGFYLGNQRSTYFKLEVSADGSAWSEVFSGQSSGTTLEPETFSFPVRPAKFVRITCNGNSSPSLWNSLTEVSIPLPGPPIPDSNELADAWEIHHFNATGQDPAADPDGDGADNRDEFILGGDPHQWNPALLQTADNGTGGLNLTLNAHAAFGPGYVGKTRRFRIVSSTTLQTDDWQTVPGHESIAGDNLPRVIAVSNDNGRRFFKLACWLE